MATPNIKSTYSLDVESVRALDVLDRLQSSVRERKINLSNWASEVKTERLAAERRGKSDSR